MKRTLAVLCGLLLIAGVASAAPGSTGLTVALSTDSASLTTSQDVVVRFTITNETGRARSVFMPATPLLDVENDLFLVQRDGERVAYLGIDAKRGPAEKTDFLVLPPGRSTSGTVELTALYDMSKPGLYTVQYRVAARTLAPETQAPAREAVTSDALMIEVTGEERVSAIDAQAPSGGGTGSASVVYRNCSATRTAELPAALSAAQSYASSASSSLTGTAGARYTTWFGAYTSSRYNTVKSHFSAISSALSTQQITFDCGCKKKYYAYVYPTKPYEIYLCTVFWQAPNTGTDSRGGTIIHETSHFNVVASTDDWVYGQSGAKSLAISDPDKAIDNADSHEYYAENNPVQR
jgi:peptidyl-Lys metalloendopeptidase